VQSLYQSLLLLIMKRDKIRKVIPWALVVIIIMAAGWYRWTSLHKEDYGAVLICVVNENPGKLTTYKYAYNRTRLICAGLDGDFWVETNFGELYKKSYSIAQIIHEGDRVVYYVHKRP
jgi:hypothetical protein